MRFKNKKKKQNPMTLTKQLKVFIKAWFNAIGTACKKKEDLMYC